MPRRQDGGRPARARGQIRWLGRLEVVFICCLWLGLAAVAAEASGQAWRSYPQVDGCIGGPRCSTQPIELRLDRRVVERLRFFAVTDDRDGERARLLVTLDGRSLDRELTVDARGRVFVLDGLGRSAEVLRFENLSRQGVRIESLEILYADDRRSAASTRSSAGDRGPLPYRDGYDDGWTVYRNEQGCIGGELCTKGSLVIRLAKEPIERLRFSAHDDFGNKFEGKLQVRIDDKILDRRLDILRQGSVHTLEARGRRGDYLIFEALGDDEVMIDTVEVLYRGAQPRRSPAATPPPVAYESRRSSGYEGPGQCIGGRLCDSRHRFEIKLEGLVLEAVRFHAHSDVGDGYDSRLRVLLDREDLAEELEIPRRGEFFELQTTGARGRLLVFEAIGRGEVVVEDIEVRYEGESWTRHRVEDSP